MTIKNKILIPMIVLTVVCAVVVLLTSIMLFNGYVDDVMHDRINAASAVVEDGFNMRKLQSYTTAIAIAENREIIKAISKNDRGALLSAARELQKNAGVEFCTVLDANGTVLARCHEPDNYGDSLASQFNIKSAISGKSVTAVEKGSAVLLSIRSGAPVYDDNGTLIGVVSVGFRMDTNTFADMMKSLTGCEVTVFLKDESISTSVLKDDRTRAVGTKADYTISREVLSGNTYIGKTKILGRNALTKYIPVYGADNDVIGMLFVGRYMSEKIDTIWAFVIDGLVVLLVILAAGIITSVVISRTIEDQVRKLITGIRHSTDMIESATTGLTKVSSSLAEGASRQAAAIEETSATMNESASMIALNAESTRHAAQLAQKSKQSADEGKAKMQEMVRSMDQLKESSDTISKIIKTIDEIAFQTNLLAINATVEAARAGGDAGRSFGAVAEEVRILAKRSADAASNTAEIIEKNIALATEGKKISGEVSGALHTVAAEFTRLNELISEINAASEEQSKGVQQINIAISQMEKVTQQTAAMAEEAAASSQSLHEEAVTLDQVVEETSKLIKDSKSN